MDVNRDISVKWMHGFIIGKAMEKRIVISTAFFLLLLVPCYSIECRDPADCLDEHASNLNYDLFEANSYNPLIRPVKNTSDSLLIRFTLVLSTIIKVDSKNQFIVTNVWLQMIWNDFQLVWDPVNYGNINETRIAVDKIWVPDIVLFNNADGKFEPSFIPNVLVYNEGRLKFIPPAIYTSSCSIDVEYFPFDQQVCQMKFGSWTFPGKTLHYMFEGNITAMEMANYMVNGEWNIISCSGHIEEIKDTITGEPKELIVYELVIRRKTLYYTVNLIIPCFLHAVVCLCVFVLPADGCEKMTLVISVLVSLVVFLVLVQKILPPSIKIPLIAKYFLFTFIMNVLEILVTVTIIFANHKSPRTEAMPKWVCWLFLYKLPKYLMMERPDHDERWQQKSCEEPPSYPSTPQISRAAIRVNTPDLKQRLARVCPSAEPIEASNRENQRVTNLRKHQKIGHGSRSSTHSSMGSDSSAGAEVAESLMLDHHSDYPIPPFNGHRCMLRESPMARSDDTLDGSGVRPRSPQTVQPQPQPQQPQREPNTNNDRNDRKQPFWMKKELYSAMNAIKFIWRQLQNKDEYETVKDDWKYVGAVLDRLLMVIFILVTLGGTVGCLINAPHILETVDEEAILEKIRNG